MLKRSLPVFVAAVIAAFSAGLANAHVPYLERTDFTCEAPFEVRKAATQSIAVYAWLEFGRDDLDVYRFSIEAPTRVFFETLVPACDGYEEFLPTFAILGPGLPLPDSAAFPFDLPDGYGAVVVPDLTPVEERPTFYEPFGNKVYFQGPRFDEIMEAPGDYFIYVWDPYVLGGDYVAVLGYEEIWQFSDILRGLLITPLIRNGRELHNDACVPGRTAEDAP